MAEISKINANNITYNIKDSTSRSALVEVVDSGAKNALQFDAVSRASHNGVDFTYNANGSVTVNAASSTSDNAYCYLNLNGSNVDVKALCDGNHMISGCPTNSSGVTLRIMGTGYTTVTDSGNGATITAYSGENVIRVAVYVAKNGTPSNIIVKPMICTKAAWDVSHQFEPYALPNPTLTPSVIKSVDEGAKNHALETDKTETRIAYIDVRPITGKYRFVIGQYTSTDTDTNNFVILFIYSDGTNETRYYPKNADINYEYTTNKYLNQIRVYASASYNQSNGDTVSISNLMICSAADYAVSPKFVPYALSNPTLTPAAIKAVDEGAKNLLKITASSSSGNVNFTVNGDGTITVDGTAGTSNAVFVVASGLTIPAGNYYISMFDNSAYYSNKMYISAQFKDTHSGSSTWSGHEYYTDTQINPAGNIQAVAIVVKAGQTISQTVQPMICTLADWNVSKKYVPYCPSLQDLVVKKATNVVNGTTTLSGTGVSIALKGGNIYRLTANAKYKAVNLSEIAIKYTISGTTYGVCSNSITPTSNVVYLTTTGLINPSSDVTVETYVKTQANGNVEILLLAEKI